MRLVEQWLEIERNLPEGWDELRLVLTTPEEHAARASAKLAPAGAGRAGNTIRFTVARGAGAGVTPERVKRLLWHIDADWITGELELASVSEAAPEAPVARREFAEAWDAESARLPEDWSDAYVQLDFVSSDLERAALLLSPLNPARHDETPSFRFRAARVFGYGASPGIVRRCLERLDGEGIRGTVRVLRVLSDTDPVATQGPVWYVGGRPV